MDPNYSVLLNVVNEEEPVKEDGECNFDEKQEEDEEKKSKKGVNTTTILIAVFVTVGVAALVAAFFVFALPRFVYFFININKWIYFKNNSRCRIRVRMAVKRNKIYESDVNVKMEDQPVRM